MTTMTSHSLVFGNTNVGGTGGGGGVKNGLDHGSGGTTQVVVPLLMLTVGVTLGTWLVVYHGRRLLANLFLKNQMTGKKTVQEAGAVLFSTPRALSILCEIEACLGVIVYTLVAALSSLALFTAATNDNDDDNNNNSTTTCTKVLSILTGHVLFELTKPRQQNRDASVKSAAATETKKNHHVFRRWNHYISELETLVTVALLVAAWNAHYNSIFSTTTTAATFASKVKHLSFEFKILGAWMAYRWVRLVFAYQAEETYRATELAAAGDGIRLNDNGLRVQSDLWCIHGVLYDMKDFVHQHPGGREAILLGQGRDATHLFESYHAFASSQKMQSILQKYKVNNNHSNHNKAPSPLPADPPTDLFYQVLKERVSKALRDQGMHPILDRGANRSRQLYYLLVMAALMVSGVLHTRGSVWGSFWLGVFGWLVGCVGHDGGHFAVSHRLPAVNEWAVWCISFLGNPFMWQQQHTYAHHSHTNSFDHDPDLHHFNQLVRYHPRHVYEPQYKMQASRYFITAAFALISFGTCLLIPIGMGLEGTVHHCVEFTDRKRTVRFFGFLLHYALYWGWIVVWPFYAQQQPGGSRLAAVAQVVVHMATCSLLFAIFSQISHINEICIAAAAKKNNKDSTTTTSATTTTTTEETSSTSEKKTLDPVRASLSTSWAVTQVEASTNYCTDSTFWFFVSNGLNMQIEHHLFPGLNHCHLHRIQPVVEATCREYGVDYKNYASWTAMWNATMDYLTRLSEMEPIKVSGN